MTQWRYAAPATLQEALAMLGDTTHQALPLAGGTRVLVDLHQGAVPASGLVDLRRLEDLRQIKLSAQTIKIGALVTFAQLEHNPLIQQHVPLLASMANFFGNPLIRAAATLGGNIAAARLALADAVVPLYALEANLLLQNVRPDQSTSQRTINIAEYLLEKPDPGELITWITLPLQAPDSFSFYAKMSNRKAGAAALASIAAHITFQERRITSASIVLGAMTLQPFRTRQVETLLSGTTLPLTTSTLASCIKTLEEELPALLNDISASAEYRAALGSALVKKALQQLSAEYEKNV